MRFPCLIISIMYSLILIRTSDCIFWDGLRTTFPTPESLLSGNWGYAAVPRLRDEALSKGWEQMDDNNSNLCSGTHFRGHRFVKRVNSSTLDCSVSPIYDVNGVIAGLQMNIPVKMAKANPSNTFDFENISMFVRNKVCGVDTYSLTSYYVDPATICTEGRPHSALESKGTGSALYFQNGTDSSTANLITAPLLRKVALSSGWTNNRCFPGMGVHNWYMMERWQASGCNRFLPVFLLYTREGELLGYGFTHIGKSYSIRYEHPDALAVGIIAGPRVAPCLLEKARGSIGVTTMHVYLIDAPLTQLCLPAPKYTK